MKTKNKFDEWRAERSLEIFRRSNMENDITQSQKYNYKIIKQRENILK